MNRAVLSPAGDEDERQLCRCCGKREGRRIGPSYSKNYLCDECLEDPAETLEECRHGFSGCRDNCVNASVFTNHGEDVYCTMPPPAQLKEVRTTCRWYEEYEGANWRGDSDD